MSLHMLFSGKPLPPRCPQCNGMGGWPNPHRGPGESPVKSCGACEGEGFAVTRSPPLDKPKACDDECSRCAASDNEMQHLCQQVEDLKRTSEELTAQLDAIATKHHDH